MGLFGSLIDLMSLLKVSLEQATPTFSCRQLEGLAKLLQVLKLKPPQTMSATQTHQQHHLHGCEVGPWRGLGGEIIS